MKLFLTALFGLLCLLPSYAQDGSLNPNFGINGRLIAPMGLPFFRVTSGCLQADGKIIVAGSAANDSTRRNTDLMMIRFNTDGSPDNSFGKNGIVYTDVLGRSSDEVVQVRALPNGKILVLGTSDWSSRMLLFRYNSNGTPDSSFAGGYWPAAIRINAYVKDFAVQPDGKILVCHGEPGPTNGFPSILSLSRFNADGSADNTLKVPTGNGYPFGDIENVFPQADGKIILAGQYVNVSVPGESVRKPYIARLLTNGVIDSSFALNGIQDISPVLSDTYSVHARPDSLNRIVVCTGYYIFGTDSFRVAANRLLPDGTPDLSFGVQGSVILADSVGGRLIQQLPVFQITPGNKILFPVTTTLHRQVREMAVMRLDANWQKDAGFGSNGFGIIPSVPDAFEAVVTLTGPNGRIYVAGYDLSHGRYRVALGALLPDGTPDNSFSGDAKTSIEAGLATYNEDGFTDMLVNSSGKITTVGLAENGPSSSLVVTRFHSNGIPDSSFGISGRAYLSLRSGHEYDRADLYRRHSGNQLIALKEDAAGNLFVVCDEYHLAIRRNAVLVYKLSANGIPDNSFGYAGRTIIDFSPYSENFVRGLAIQSDGRLLVACYVGMPVHDSSYTAVMRLQLNGAIDSSFANKGRLVNGSFLSTVQFLLSAPNQLVVQPDDKILLTGHPESFIYTRLGIQRYTANGEVDTLFGRGAPLTLYPSTSYAYTSAIAVQPDGKILLGGTYANKLLVRLDKNGHFDGYFGRDGIAQDAGRGNTSNILLQPDGKILLVGDTYIGYPWGGRTYIEVSRLQADGYPDKTFGNSGKLSFPLSPIYGDLAGNIGLLPDGNIVIAGITGIDWDGLHQLSTPHSVFYGLTNTIQNCSIVKVEAGADTVVCQAAGAGVTLGASALPDATYSWMPTIGLNNGTLAQPVANPIISTRYTVKLTTPVGCVAMDTVRVNVEIPVTLPLSANGNFSFCNGGSVQLSTTATGNLQWLKNNLVIPGANGTSYTATDSGLYRVVQVNAQHCYPSSNVVQVILYPSIAKPVITQTGTTLVSSPAFRYQWYLNNVLIPGASAQSFAPTVPGNYTVITTSPFGCQSGASAPFAFVPTGINSPELEKKITMGPNPVEGKLFIQYTGNYAVFDVTLLDLTGQHVLASGKFSSSIAFNLQPYAAGLYIVQIKNNKTGEFLQKKIFKSYQ